MTRRPRYGVVGRKPLVEEQPASEAGPLRRRFLRRLLEELFHSERWRRDRPDRVIGVQLGLTGPWLTTAHQRRDGQCRSDLDRRGVLHSAPAPRKRLSVSRFSMSRGSTSIA